MMDLGDAGVWLLVLGLLSFWFEEPLSPLGVD